MISISIYVHFRINGSYEERNNAILEDAKAFGISSAIVGVVQFVILASSVAVLNFAAKKQVIKTWRHFGKSLRQIYNIHMYVLCYFNEFRISLHFFLTVSFAILTKFNCGSLNSLLILFFISCFNWNFNIVVLLKSSENYSYTYTNELLYSIKLYCCRRKTNTEPSHLYKSGDSYVGNILFALH